jgi:hypothetical protein
MKTKNNVSNLPNQVPTQYWFPPMLICYCFLYINHQVGYQKKIE